MDVKDILVLLNKAVDDLEQRLDGVLTEVSEYRKLQHPSKPLGMISSMDEGLLRAITEWCRVKGIVTAEDFTSKVSAVKSWPN